MSSMVAKCVGALIVFSCNVVASFGTFLYILSKCQIRTIPKSLKAALSAASCFSIGLFLGICYLGLYHSASAKMNEVQSKLPHTVWIKAYPVSEALLCLGFFILWLSEGLIHIIINRLMGNAPPSKYMNYSPVRVLSMTKLRLDPSSEEADDEMDLLETQGGHTLSAVASDTPVLVNGNSNSRARDDSRNMDSFIRSVILTFAMGLHTFLEALGFGLLDTLNEVISMGLAMVLHQTLCAITLGLRLARASNSRRKRCYTVLLLIFYLSLVPAGTGIGLSLQYTHRTTSFSPSVCHGPVSSCTSANVTTDVVPSGHLYTATLMSVVQNFASAAFLYVVFMEILPSELSTGAFSGTNCHTASAGDSDTNHKFRNHNLVSCLCALLGFLFLALLRVFHHHDHS
ncbi:hypothetical protein D915_007079 [Fasciola hepatica]|uniref:Zinc transporter ZIP1 n=1 Tax=Fasciola hepatica TaxID=6192 RepID=A0A4E0R8X0_FASHE|nr:hypothetical protein D915_007079 [Fasciola hepatica]